MSSAPKRIEKLQHFKRERIPERVVHAMSGDITTRDRLRAARRGLGGVIVVWGMALAGLQGWRIG